MYNVILIVNHYYVNICNEFIVLKSEYQDYIS